MTQSTCPACEKPCETSEMIAGVCARCKGSFKAAHKSVDVLGDRQTKWDAEDVSIPKSGGAIETAYSPEEMFQVLIENDEAEDERAVEIIRRFKVGMSVCMSYEGNKALALDCFALSMGMRDLLAETKDSDLAARHNVSKQSVTKCKLMFQERMGIEPMGGQRSKEARENMRVARQKQLK